MRRSSLEPVLRFVWLLLLLFGFLVAIETMSKAIKFLADPEVLGGGGDQSSLFALGSNPFAALSLGVLFTVLVQSSSTTTSTIVAVVGAGVITVEQAVPMILGANIGTTITNTLVSLGHVRRSGEFRRAYAAATVHDFFNLIAVGLMLPLEMATGFLSSSAASLTGLLGKGEGVSYKSPIKVAIKDVHKQILSLLEGIGFDGNALGITALITGILLTFLCLAQITINMRRLMAGRLENAMNTALGGKPWKGMAAGVGITVAVQSSSVTTSLMVPMCAAGIMSLETAFPVMLGANIGTTVTGVLASIAQDKPEALTIALVHVLFNVIAVSVLIFVPATRQLPIRLARSLAVKVTRNRIWALIYVGGVFVAVPILGWVLWKSDA